MDAVDLKLAPTTVRRLFSTVERVGITVATFMADFCLGLHYGVCFILLPPLPPPPTAPPPPTRPPPRYARPEISAHLKKICSKAVKTSLHGFLRLDVQKLMI